MTIEEVRKHLARIERVTNDPESAHSADDFLRELVLLAIAEGASNAKELASEALKSSAIQFPRWFA